MSFWNPEKSYPTDALYSVTIKATDGQRSRWTRAAKQRQMARGAFIAFAADFYCNLADAAERTHEDYEREMHPERYR